MGASFESEIAPDAVAHDLGHRGLDAARVAGREAEHLEPPPAIRGVPLVHLEQIARPQAGFISTDPGPDLEDHRSDRAVVGTDQLGLDRRREIREPAFDGGEFLAGERDEFRVVAGRDRGLVLRSLPGRGVEGDEPFHHAGERLALRREAGDLAMVGEHRGILESATEVVVLFTKFLELATKIFREFDGHVRRGGAGVGPVRWWWRWRRRRRSATRPAAASGGAGLGEVAGMTGSRRGPNPSAN